MNKKVILFAVLLLLVLAPTATAWSWDPATWVSRAFKIGDGKDIDLNGRGIGNGQVSDVWCVQNCSGFINTTGNGSNLNLTGNLTAPRIGGIIYIDAIRLEFSDINSAINVSSDRNSKRKIIVSGNWTISQAIVLQNFTILDMTGAYILHNTSTNGGGISIPANTHDVEIIGGTLDNSYNAQGHTFSITAGGNLKNITIRDMTIIGNRSHPTVSDYIMQVQSYSDLNLKSENVIIERNTFVLNRTRADVNSNSLSGINLDNFRNVKVKNNIFININNDLVIGNSGSWTTYHSQNLEYSGNTKYQTNTLTSGEGPDIGGVDGVIEEGNYQENFVTISGTTSVGGLGSSGLASNRNVRIINNVIKNMSNGIGIGGYSVDGLIISQNQLYMIGQNGGNGRNCIIFQTLTGTNTYNNVVISNNICTNVSYFGITSSSTDQIQNATISGNTITNSGRGAMDLYLGNYSKVVYNSVIGASFEAVNTWNALAFQGHNITISDNTIVDNRKIQAGALTERVGSFNNTITDNFFVGFNTALTTYSGTNTIHFQNRGESPLYFGNMNRANGQTNYSAYGVGDTFNNVTATGGTRKNDICIATAAGISSWVFAGNRSGSC